MAIAIARRSGWGELVEAGAVAAENGLLLSLRELRDVILHELHGGSVGAGCGANWPVGTNHEAFRAEGFEDDIEIRPEMFDAPVAPARFSDHAGDFAEEIGCLREDADVRAPRIESTACDGRLGDMVEDEALLREAVDELDSCFELPRIDKDVVCEVEGSQMGYALLKVGAEEEVVGLVLDDMTDADQFWIAGKVVQQGVDVGRAQVDPSHDAADEVMAGGQVEEPLCFLEGLPGLHGNAALEAVLMEERLEVGGKKVAAQGGHGIVDPGIFDGVVLPKVLMSIDTH